ncbi:MAG: ABC transporter permease subunit [Cyanobacteria bacterium NC_groundwater_1444_Ag_S-0.65um_54_12]|nr:ABC transporter permease subunit [Cyanobacteria bacterium NC_groundwater_1444_Ag_S-0.65um_54_12]
MFNIARIFFHEAVRDRILNLIWLFALVMLGLSLWLGDLSAGNELKVVKDLALGIINLLLIMVAMMTGSNAIYQEIERRTAYVVLAKPVARWQFLLGKFTGLVGVLALLATAMGLAYYFLIWFATGKPVEASHSLAIVFMFGEATLLAAIALLFSSITSPLLSMIYVLGLYVVGHNTELILRFGEKDGTAIITRYLGQFIYRTLPNLEVLNLKNQVVYGHSINWSEGIWVSSYAVIYVAIFLMLAVLAFSKREI